MSAFFAAAGLGLSLLHPVQPAVVACVWLAVATLLFLRPSFWLVLVPACLPVLNFSPWTGWTLVSEFDLLLCAVCAAGWLPRGPVAQMGGRAFTVADLWVGAFAVTSAISLLRGHVLSAGWLPGDSWDVHSLRALLFADYESAANGWRNAKAVLWLVALWPLWRDASTELVHRSAALQVWARGMRVGMALLCAVVVWERVAFSGLWDGSSGYRVMGWFWEMHTGGAAIDMYLALAMPFVTLRFAQDWFAPLGDGRAGRCLLSLALLSLAIYATLVTFSRSAYVAVLLPNVLLLVVLYLQCTPQPKLLQAGGWMAVAATMLLGAAFWGGGFLQNRMDRAMVDLSFRVGHWRHAMGVLQSGADALLGVGLGRLPSLYAQQTESPVPVTDAGGRHPGSGWPGRAVWVTTKTTNEGSTTAYLKLSGPDRDPNTRGLWSLQQRLGGFEPSAYRVRLRARASQAADLWVKVCEQHVVYSLRCVGQVLRLRGFDTAGTDWQDLGAVMWPVDSVSPKSDASVGQRPAVFSVTVVTVGAKVEIASIQVLDPAGASKLKNGDFSGASAHWFPGASSYFLPWHVDNLYLEILLERGMVGFSVLLGGFLWLVLRLVQRRRSALRATTPSGLGLVLVIGVLSVMILGLVGSVMEVPRVSGLFLFLLAVLLQGKNQLGRRDENG